MSEETRSLDFAINPRTNDYVWCRCGDSIRTDDAVCGNCHDPMHPTDERTRRVDACLAACAGIPTAALEVGALAKALEAAAIALFVVTEDESVRELKVSTRSLVSQARQAFIALGRLTP